MSLEPGATLGPYRIVALLGAGAMGEVYRAHDVKLRRDVALKILPAAFAADPDSRARFTREARVLASVNHPNIAAIYGLEESGSVTALVMELVEGETLADRIARGPLPFSEALALMSQIAAGLDAAHERGIVHRDLKPANITVGPDGAVKLLDFGLARFFAGDVADARGVSADQDADLSQSPTVSAPLMTQPGVILGTVAYMAPEQARGRAVDKRADIWSFGCVVYEMLAGHRPFPGRTAADIIASVMTLEPDWTVLSRSDVPATIVALLKRCLAKEPRARLRDIGDALHELDFQTPAGAADAAGGARVRSDARTRRLLKQAAILVIGVAAAAAVGTAIARVWSPETATTWIGTELGGPNTAWVPRLSPDGQMLAFVAFVDGLPQVAVINPQTGHWSALTKDRTRGYVSRISWSPDGSRIFYARYGDVPRGVFSVPVLGGEERLVLENATGGEALPDGSLLVGRLNEARRIQLHRFWPGDGRLQPLPALVTDPELVPVRVLPDGRGAVFWGRTLEQPDSDPASRLHALDLVAARAEPIAAGVSVSPTARVGSAALAVMPGGRSVLVSMPQGDAMQLSAVDLDGSGRIRPLHHLTHFSNEIDVGADSSVYVAQAYRTNEVWTFGVDGSRPRQLNVHDSLRLRYASVVNAIHSPAGHTWLAGIVGGRPRLMAAAPGGDAIPFIDTDEPTDGPMALVGDDRIAFIIGNGDARRIAIASRADGRILRRLADIDASTIVALTASPDAKELFYVDAGAIWRVPLDGGGPRKIRAGDGVAVTPDGRRLIIQLVESGGVRWMTTDLDGTSEQAIAVKGDARFTPAPIGPGAVAPDGRVALPVSPTGAYFWSSAIFDPRTGAVARIPMPVAADAPFPSWTEDGRVIVVTHGLRSTLWRFTPVAP
jgi:dipeptidyl aminopeptidase/acylaminoacyl peptidase